MVNQARPIPDIINAVAKKSETSGDTRITTDSIDYIESANKEGNKYNFIYQFNVSIAEPLYLLLEIPNGADCCIEFIERMFSTTTAGADLLILWDYDVSTASKTPIIPFNCNNNFRGIKDTKLEVSVLNNVVQSQSTGIFDVTAGATILDQGIVREPSTIPTVGTGSNKSGGVSPEAGSRIYCEGTGALLKITSKGNDNLITLGYTFVEDNCNGN